MINSFRQEELDEFRWYDVDFKAEINSNILYIYFTGEYYGAYPNHVKEALYFDLKTGDVLINKDIPFQALFHLKGYLSFIHKYWLKGIKKEFDAAIECTEGTEPYCNYYDISNYQIENTELHFKLIEDCYPRVIQSCSPIYSTSVPIDSLMPYLSSFGKKILFEDHYTQLTGIDKYLYNEKNSNDIPNYQYIFGKIADQYPFSMAISVDETTGEVDGYYFYDKKMTDLSLTGMMKGSNMYLTESLNHEISGHFTFTYHSAYNVKAFFVSKKNKYLKGFWFSRDHSKKLNITINEVKLNK